MSSYIIDKPLLRFTLCRTKKGGKKKRKEKKRLEVHCKCVSSFLFLVLVKSLHVPTSPSVFNRELSQETKMWQKCCFGPNAQFVVHSDITLLHNICHSPTTTMTHLSHCYRCILGVIGEHLACTMSLCKAAIFSTKERKTHGSGQNIFKSTGSLKCSLLIYVRAIEDSKLIILLLK